MAAKSLQFRAILLQFGGEALLGILLLRIPLLRISVRLAIERHEHGEFTTVVQPQLVAQCQ
jgi:hypothetical protein